MCSKHKLTGCYFSIMSTDDEYIFVTGKRIYGTAGGQMANQLCSGTGIQISQKIVSNRIRTKDCCVCLTENKAP